jgi:AmiR/NasT family two-component response regulator
MDRPIRVLVAYPLKLMREALMEAFAAQQDIEVQEVSEESEIPTRVQETRPDFVFIRSHDPDIRPSVCDAVFRVHPDANVIAIVEHANLCVRYWVASIIRSSCMESSGASILAAVRGRTVLEGETPCKGSVN